MNRCINHAHVLTCLFTALVLASSAPVAFSGPQNTAVIGVDQDDNVGRSAGTVTVKVKLSDGETKVVTVNVPPESGMSSKQIMEEAARQLNADGRFVATAENIKRNGEWHTMLRVRGNGTGGDVSSATIDTGTTGLHNPVVFQSNQTDWTLENDGSGRGTMNRFRAIIHDRTSPVLDFAFDVPDGMSASAILLAAATELGSHSLFTSLSGDTLSIHDTPLRWSVSLNLQPIDAAFGPVSYDQSLTAHVVPTPGACAILAMAGILASRRRRHLAHTPCG